MGTQEDEVLRELGATLGIDATEVEQKIALLNQADEVVKYLTSYSHQALHAYYAGDFQRASDLQGGVRELLETMPSSLVIDVLEQFVLNAASAEHEGK